MRRVIHDLFFAGSERTSTALDCAFLLVAEYPGVQEKCQQEIQKVDKINECKHQLHKMMANYILSVIKRCNQKEIRKKKKKKKKKKT